jgi:ATP dependent DNA ligase domain
MPICAWTTSGKICRVGMPFQPMLATNSAPRTLAGRWVLEPKFDGWRVIVAIDEAVRVWTRRGHEMTHRLPELASLPDMLNTRVVLDGELVAGQGRASDFYSVLPRVARSAPLSFVAFDVLAYNGAPVIDETTRAGGSCSTGSDCATTRGARPRSCTARCSTCSRCVPSSSRVNKPLPKRKRSAGDFTRVRVAF